MSDHAAIVRDEAEKISSILSYEPTPFQLEQAVNFLAVTVIREIDALVAERDADGLLLSQAHLAVDAAEAEAERWHTNHDLLLILKEAAEAERDEALAANEAAKQFSYASHRQRAEAAEARVTELEAALREYADPRNWGISRDDLNHRVVSWIGPGAEVKGIPDAPGIARAALAKEDTDE